MQHAPEPQSFAEASRVEPREGHHRFGAQVPDGWQQGRGAYGGLGIAIALRALEGVETERPLRAVTAELPGPLLAGEADITVQTLHRGRGITSLEAHVSQGEEVKVRVSGVFGRTRVEDRSWSAEPPIFGDWRAVDVATLGGGVGPVFAQHFEYRPTGPMPMQGTRPEAEGWVRPRVALDRLGGPEVAALADCYWPAALATERELRPVATVSYTLSLMDAAHRLNPDAPLFHRGRVLSGDSGYMMEMRELWTADGELVALNPQTIVMIK